MSTLNIQSLCGKSKRFPYNIAICFLNWCHDYPQWLELPMSRMHFHCPEDVRAIEVRLYHQSLCSPFVYSVVFNDSVNGQGPDQTGNAQAGLGLHFPH